MLVILFNFKILSNLYHFENISLFHVFFYAFPGSEIVESCLSLPLTTALATFFLFTLIFALSPLPECPEQARQFQDLVCITFAL